MPYIVKFTFDVKQDTFSVGLQLESLFDAFCEGVNGSDGRGAGLEAKFFAAYPVVHSCEVLQSS